MALDLERAPIETSTITATARPPISHHSLAPSGDGKCCAPTVVIKRKRITSRPGLSRRLRWPSGAEKQRPEPKIGLSPDRAELRDTGVRKILPEFWRSPVMVQHA